MKPLRERNPAWVGAAGTALLAVALLLVVVLPRLPSVNGTRTYRADFAQAAGLSTGDDVRVAGVPVGSVTRIRLAGTVIEVTFHVPNSLALGSRTTASIEVGTLLGTKYVELTPVGAGSLSAKAPIPLARTAVPFDLYQVTGGLTATVQGLDVPQLQRALHTLSHTFSGTAPLTRKAFDGLSGISQVIETRRTQLQDLVRHAQTVTATLAAQRNTLLALFGDADTVFRTLQQRRTVIHSLLVESATLGRQLHRIITRDGSTLGPLLNHLQVVGDVLRKDETQLGHAVDLLAPATRTLANATGNGRYLDINSASLLIPDNVLCGFSLAKDCQ